MTEITVFFPEREDRTFVDSEARIYICEVHDGHLYIYDRVKLIPSRPASSWKKQRTIHVHPPGTWLEVEVDYGS